MHIPGLPLKRLECTVPASSEQMPGSCIANNVRKQKSAAVMQTFPYITLRCFFHVSPMAMTTASTCDPSVSSVFSRCIGSNLFAIFAWGIFGNTWSTGNHLSRERTVAMVGDTQHHLFTIS